MSITSKQAGMVPGCGFDSRIREIRNSAINYDRVEDTQSTDIGKVHRVEQVVCEVRNNVDLANTLGCELGVSLVSMPLGAGAKLARGTRFSQHKKYYATSIEKVIIEKNLVKPCLHNEAIDILNGKGSQEFFDCYGDKYVSGFEYGGKLCVVMEISGKNTENFSSFEGGLLTEGLNFFSSLLNISCGFKAASNNISENFEMSFHASQHGGMSDWQPRSIEELKDYIDKFLKEVEQRPVAINAITASYKDLAREYDLSPEYDLIQTKRMAIESVSSKVLALETYMTRLNNAEFYQKDSQLAKNIYNAKAGVYNALDILNTWLQAAIYSKGFDIFERIPNLSISNIVIEEVPFY